jgi:hypothetical protein
MKKIPTLFERVFENHRIVDIKPEVAPELEWVLNGEGVATVKVDGSCCSIIDGKLFKRYDAKKGKPIPENAIKCQEEADPVTGHLPCWVPVDENDPRDKWFVEAYKTTKESVPDSLYDGTYEAIGKHFNGNPYNMTEDMLIRHGLININVPRTFIGIKAYLLFIPIEGIVFWKDGEPKCKIKRSDFGFEWPCENATINPDMVGVDEVLESAKNGDPMIVGVDLNNKDE